MLVGTTKIITTTEEDFLQAEIAEWGYDYCDEKFAEGYEPTFVNGVWCWRMPKGTTTSKPSLHLNFVSY